MKSKFLFLLSVVFFLLLACENKDLHKTSPVLTLKGLSVMEISLDENYVEPGYIAYDSIDADLTSRVLVDTTQLNTSKEGIYKIYYSVQNRYGNEPVAAERIIKVVRTGGSLTLKGKSFLSFHLGEFEIFQDPGFIALDVDGTLKNQAVKLTSNLNLNKPGLYRIDYSFQDSFGVLYNSTRSIQVVLPAIPVIILEGKGMTTNDVFVFQTGMNIEEMAILDPGYRAFSKELGDITQRVTANYHEINTNLGYEHLQELTYTIHSTREPFDVLATAMRYVRILADATPPEVLILKAERETVEVGGSFVVDLTTDVIAMENGTPLNSSVLRYTINQYNDFTDAGILIRENVPVEEVTVDAGFFRVVYFASDPSGNEGTNFRLVQSVDLEKPQLVFNGAIVERDMERREEYLYGSSLAFIIANPTVTDNARTFSLVEEGDRFSSINSRRVGDYRVLLYGIDASGNKSFSIRRTIRILPPPPLNVVNGSFEDFLPAVGKIDEANRLIGWQWVNMRGYLVQGTYQQWSSPHTTIDPVILLAEADGQYGSKSVAAASDAFSRTGIVSAFTTGAVKTAEQVNDPVIGIVPISLAAFITRSRGNLVQKDIALFKDVHYVAEMFSRTEISESSQWVYFKIKAQTPGMKLNGEDSVEFLADPREMTQNYWDRFLLEFTANIDGVITIEIEKTDIGNSHRNGTEFYYDDVSIYVQENGYSRK